MKHFFKKLKRIYEIYFENRDIEIIREDFYSGKFVSKEEMRILFASELKYLTDLVLFERDNYNKLFENFRIGTMGAYYAAEEKTVKSGRLI